MYPNHKYAYREWGILWTDIPGIIAGISAFLWIFFGVTLWAETDPGKNMEDLFRIVLIFFLHIVGILFTLTKRGWVT